jgi:hypothetical protein
MEKQLLSKAIEQEQYLIRLRDSIINRHKSPDESSTYNFERAKFIGMLTMLDAVGIDRKQFNWIF